MFLFLDDNLVILLKTDKSYSCSWNFTGKNLIFKLQHKLFILKKKIKTTEVKSILLDVFS